jgi:cytochrome c oxidase cbb3-type subunit III
MRAALSTVALALAAAAFSYGCKPAPGPEVQAARSAGKVIYDQQCAICHGKTGKGDTMIAASYPYGDLTNDDWGYGGTREDLIRSVTDGIPKTPMRGFKGALSEKEIESVVEYILELSGT